MGIDCCHKRLQSYGNVSPQDFLETGRDSHSSSHKHIKADLYWCIKRRQSAHGAVHAVVSANGANPTSVDVCEFKKVTPCQLADRYRRSAGIKNLRV